MNLVENFILSVDDAFFKKCNQGNELGKMQMLSGFGNKYTGTGHCIDRNEFSYNCNSKKDRL